MTHLLVGPMNVSPDANSSFKESQQCFFTTPVLPNQPHLIYGDSHLKKYKLLNRLDEKEPASELLSNSKTSAVLVPSKSSNSISSKAKKEYSDSDLFSESLPDEFLREALFSLCESSKTGDLKAFQEMIEILLLHYNGDLSLSSLPFPMRNTPIHIAALEGKTCIVEYLLSKSLLDIDIQDSNLETPLMKCCKSGHLPIAQILLKHGADINKVDSQGWTALHNASANGDIDLVSFLVEDGKALVNSQSSRGFTPLMDATARGFPDIVKYLISQPYSLCNPTLKNSIGETAYAIAACCESVYLCDLLENAENVFFKENSSSMNQIEPLARLVSVYENERCASPGKLKGLWSSTKSFSPVNLTDNYHHFTYRGTHEPAQLSLVSLPIEDGSNWSWQTDWKLCTNIPKVDHVTGWQYAKSFDSYDHYWTAEPPSNPTSWVRRRRWVRIARKAFQLE